MRPPEDYGTWTEKFAWLSLAMHVVAALISFAIMAAGAFDGDYAKATFWLILLILNLHLAKATIEDWAP